MSTPGAQSVRMATVMFGIAAAVESLTAAAYLLAGHAGLATVFAVPAAIFLAFAVVCFTRRP